MATHFITLCRLKNTQTQVFHFCRKFRNAVGLMDYVTYEFIQCLSQCIASTGVGRPRQLASTIWGEVTNFKLYLSKHFWLMIASFINFSVQTNFTWSSIYFPWQCQHWAKYSSKRKGLRLWEDVSPNNFVDGICKCIHPPIFWKCVQLFALHLINFKSNKFQTIIDL